MSKLTIPKIKEDIILERSEQNRCPICNKEFTKSEINELKDISYIRYQNKSYLSKLDATEILIHKKHIKEYNV